MQRRPSKLHNHQDKFFLQHYDTMKKILGNKEIPLKERIQLLKEIVIQPQMSAHDKSFRLYDMGKIILGDKEIPLKERIQHLKEIVIQPQMSAHDKSFLLYNMGKIILGDEEIPLKERIRLLKENVLVPETNTSNRSFLLNDLEKIIHTDQQITKQITDLRSKLMTQINAQLRQGLSKKVIPVDPSRQSQQVKPVEASRVKPVEASRKSQQLKSAIPERISEALDIINYVKSDNVTVSDPQYNKKEGSWKFTIKKNSRFSFPMTVKTTSGIRFSVSCGGLGDLFGNVTIIEKDPQHVLADVLYKRAWRNSLITCLGKNSVKLLQQLPLLKEPTKQQMQKLHVAAATTT